MDIKITIAHLVQYRAVRNNAVDALRDFVANDEHSLEDKWSVYTKYIELTIDNKDLVAKVESISIPDDAKTLVLQNFINDI